MESGTRLRHDVKDTLIPLFPIVGIGTSAGGLEAFTRLLEHLPATTGMAYVLVQHLDPTHKSMLVGLLARVTRMDVHEVSEGMEVYANHVYIIAPNTDLTLSGRSLRLVPRSKLTRQHLPIDIFLTSLAENIEDQAIGVILSGTGSDGTRGFQAIKEHGGITFAQDTQSAQYAAMPESALAAGCVDFIGSPEEIARELARISRNESPLLVNIGHDQGETEDTLPFQQMLHLLSLRTDVDFTLYKPATLKRRMQHRMLLSQINSEVDYLTYLHDHPSEVQALSQDFLIGVTAFFRDPGTEQALRDEAFPRLIKGYSSPNPLRIWVPGCSTGEEVYSLAICLQEFLSTRSEVIPFQIFGTDLHSAAIEHARKGIYVPSMLTGVPPERLERFFLSASANVQISPSLRECCVFAQHNLLKDPPFSHLDLLSCQNVLIYLKAVAQKKIFQLFHYALNTQGLLLLGSSETIGTASDLFACAGQYRHLYLKKATSVHSWFVGNVGGLVRGGPLDKPKEGNDMRSKENIQAFDVQKEMDRLLLAKYTPASVVIDADMQILQFRGPTHLYLQPPSGKASFNLFKMARESLGIELRTAISKVKKSGEPVKQGGIQMKNEGGVREVQVEVIPIQASNSEFYFMIVFEEMLMMSSFPNVPPQKTENRGDEVWNRRIQHLEREVETTRTQMHTIIEELEAANEELQSANEEVLSSNEELRSLNEELETSKEEIQASNEELLITNQELQQRNTELDTAREYADAIVKTIREPLLVLDADLRVQSANPVFYQFFQVDPVQTEHHLLFELEEGQWDIPALRTLLEDLLPTNHAFTDYTMEYTFPHIGHRTMLLNAHRIDHVPLILLAMEDITSLTKAVKEKQQLLSQREEFMAIASHELKTPVTTLKGNIQLLHRRLQKEGNEQALPLLTKMDTQTKKIVILINELLDVSTIETGKLQWSTEEVDLNALVRECVEDIEQTTQQHQIHIEGTLPRLVFGNTERISQVLTNLLSNAVKYSPQGETILVTLLAGKDVATIGVQDFGIGIAAEKHEHLFERFFRVGGEEYTMVPGLGLGLYISAEIIKRHGGRMWVESCLGKGSTFFFTIPYYKRDDLE